MRISDWSSYVCSSDLLRRRDKPAPIRGAEQIVGEFGKLPSADQAFIADQQWRIDLFIAILRRLPVKHELRQRAMQAGHLPTQGSKACPRHGGDRKSVWEGKSV